MDSVKIIFIIGYFIFIKWYTYIINLKFSLLKLKPKTKNICAHEYEKQCTEPDYKKCFLRKGSRKKKFEGGGEGRAIKEKRTFF